MTQRFPMDIDPLTHKNRRLAIWAITPNGWALAGKIQKELAGHVFMSKKISPGHNSADTTVFDTLSASIEKAFNQFTDHIFIFSTGIAIRMIAPLIQSKLTDPAVVVMDDNGRHAISLISGHLGGANELAKKVATIVDAVPVITTATDVNHLPSIDMICKETGLYIETPENIKHINMALLSNERIHVDDPYKLIDHRLPRHLLSPSKDSIKPENKIICDYKTGSVSRETFVARPIVLAVGMGCNRNTPFEVIRDFLYETFDTAQLSLNSIKEIGTTDVKKDEPGLLALATALNRPIRFYDKALLNSVTQVPNPSAMVEKHLGVKSVCEAAALLAAGNGNPKKSKLILNKQKNKDVTIAVAIKP